MFLLTFRFKRDDKFLHNFRTLVLCTLCRAHESHESRTSQFYRLNWTLASCVPLKTTYRTSRPRICSYKSQRGENTIRLESAAVLLQIHNTSENWTFWSKMNRRADWENTEKHHSSSREGGLSDQISIKFWNQSKVNGKQEWILIYLCKFEG